MPAQSAFLPDFAGVDVSSAMLMECHYAVAA